MPELLTGHSAHDPRVITIIRRQPELFTSMGSDFIRSISNNCGRAVGIVMSCSLRWYRTAYRCSKQHTQLNAFLQQQPRNSFCFHPKCPQAGLSHIQVIVEKSVAPNARSSSAAWFYAPVSTQTEAKYFNYSFRCMVTRLRHTNRKWEPIFSLLSFLKEKKRSPCCVCVCVSVWTYETNYRFSRNLT